MVIFSRVNLLVRPGSDFRAVPSWEDTSMTPEKFQDPSEPNLTLLEGDIVEVSVLLAGWQANALEAAARGQGLTTGQMVRRLIHDYFGKFAHPRPA
jgi:hypothetical protein